MRLVKWTVRVVAGVVVIGVLVVAGTLVTYYVWERGHVETLEARSQVIDTAQGKIEYSDEGEGAPRLMIHGTPGGYDQMLVAGDVRPSSAEGWRTIAVSRPGYLRTPLESGRTPAEQADLYTALLDELDVETAVVYGASGGAPSALQFAFRHPERTSALVLLVPLLVNLDGEPDSPPSGFDLSVRDVTSWLVSRLSPAAFIPDLDPDDPLMETSAHKMVDSTIPARLREPGHRNDSIEFRRMAIESWPLETLTVPVLIIHGDADANAPYAGSVRAAERLPNARLVTYAGEEHLMVLTRAEDMYDDIDRFLRGLERPDDVPGAPASE